MNYELSPAHMKGDTVLKKGQAEKVPVKEPTAQELENHYRQLTNSYVIFICTYDLFGQGLYCYEFENICKDNTELSLNDGRKTII